MKSGKFQYVRQTYVTPVLVYSYWYRMSCVCHSSFHGFTVEHKTPVPFFIMNSNETRNQILDETFKLFLVNNWETITIEKIEHQMGRTRGAIFYFFKNKKNYLKK